jgi:hypothetical protein
MRGPGAETQRRESQDDDRDESPTGDSVPAPNRVPEPDRLAPCGEHDIRVHVP